MIVKPRPPPKEKHAKLKEIVDNRVNKNKTFAEGLIGISPNWKPNSTPISKASTNGSSKEKAIAASPPALGGACGGLPQFHDSSQTQQELSLGRPVFCTYCAVLLFKASCEMKPSHFPRPPIQYRAGRRPVPKTSARESTDFRIEVTARKTTLSSLPAPFVKNAKRTKRMRACIECRCILQTTLPKVRTAIASGKTSTSPPAKHVGCTVNCEPSRKHIRSSSVCF